jgi:hypothetical protein
METDPKIMKAVEKWAEEQPKPDETKIIFSSRDFSPSQIVEEVRKGTRLGEIVYACFEEIYLLGKEDSFTSSCL